MPMIDHYAALFVLMPETPLDVTGTDVQLHEVSQIKQALNRLEADQLRHIAGPLGGTNGYYSVAILPSGASSRAIDPDELFTAVRAELTKIDPDVRVLRVMFGGDCGRTEVIETTDPEIWVRSGVVLPDDQLPSQRQFRRGVWVRTLR